MEGKNNVKKIIKYLLVIVIFTLSAPFALNLLSVALMHSLKFLINADLKILMNQYKLIELVSEVILSVFYLIMYKLILGKNITEKLEDVNLCKLGKSIIIGVGVPGISLIWLTIAKYIPQFSEALKFLEKSSQDIVSGNPLIAILTVAVFGPIIEEILFRGIIFNSIEKLKKGIAPIIISSILFGLCHMISVQIVYTFFMGIVVAIVYSKTRNLIYPIIIHIVNNLLSAITGLLPNPIIEKTIDIATLVMIIPTIYFLIKLGKQKQTI